MSMYRGFMAATQAANTINSRRATLAAQALLAHQQSVQERQAQLEGIRQTLFEAASVVQDAQTALPASPAAAYYLTRRVAPVLDSGGLDASDFPDLTDKAFHRQATQAYRQTLTAASRALGPDARTAADRLVYIDTVSPELTRYAAWRDVVGCIKDGYRPDANPGFISGLGGPIVAVILGSTFIHGMLHNTFGWILGIGISGALVGRWFMRRVRVENRVEATFKALGEPVPVGLTSDDWRTRVKHLAARLASAGVAAPLLADGDVRAEVRRLADERAGLWPQVMGGLQASDAVGGGWAELPA